MKPEDWPAKIGSFLAGEIGEADLLNAAESAIVDVEMVETVRFPGTSAVEGCHRSLQNQPVGV